MSDKPPRAADTFERRFPAAPPNPLNRGSQPELTATLPPGFNPFSQAPEEKVVGSAIIYGTRNHKPVKAIVKSKHHPAYFAPDNEHRESFNLYVQDVLKGYTTVITEGPDLHINYMESTDRKNYEGVGTALHQIAVEASMQRGHHGRVTLDSLDSAVGFHYKSGYRTTSKKLDDKIQREIRKAERKGDKEPEINVSTTLLAMHLPDKKIREWKSVIAQKAILTVPHN